MSILHTVKIVTFVFFLAALVLHFNINKVGFSPPWIHPPFPSQKLKKFLFCTASEASVVGADSCGLFVLIRRTQRPDTERIQSYVQ